ncbi:MAG TPA: NfeD family protein [Candidatus Limnocylindria bacterium]|nr:NfeD family protein [Candidatus Limnocylindria bacterium]
MPTIEVPIEDLVFVLAALVGGGLLLITVVVDDVLGGILDAIHIDFSIGGISLMPPLLAFIAMFGVGGIFATQVLNLHGGPAAIVGVGFGVFGFALAFLLFRTLKRAEGDRPFSVGDLVGRTGSISTAIPAGRLGTVYVRAEGQNHEITATASEDIPSGAAVKVVGTAGMGLVVERMTPQPIVSGPVGMPSEPADPPSTPATEPAKGDTTGA